MKNTIKKSNKGVEKMKNTKNQKLSLTMKKIWEENPERFTKHINQQSKEKQSTRIKKHFQEHPEHKTAISNAQKHRWQKIKLALKYCENKGINLEVEPI